MITIINYAKQKRHLEETILAAVQLAPLDYGVNIKLDPCGSPQSFNVTVKGEPVLSVDCMKDFYGQIYGYKFDGMYNGVQYLKRDIDSYAIQDEATHVMETLYTQDYIEKIKAEVLGDEEDTQDSTSY